MRGRAFTLGLLLLAACEHGSIVPLERALNRQSPGALDWRIPPDDSALPLLDRWESAPPNLTDVDRALLQRDLWMTFDRHPDGEVRRRIAEMLLRLALPPAAIRALPDPYLASAVEYPSDFDPKDPEQPFLPRGLEDPKGPWVLFDADYRIPSLHLYFVNYRAGFLIFLRHPQGREAGMEFIRHLSVDHYPRIPAGMTFLLLRRALLISTDGTPLPSPLTETVQIRHYGGSNGGEQAVFKFELHRDDLKLHPLGRSEARPMYAMVFESSFLQVSPRTPALSTCLNCHPNAGPAGVQIFIRLSGAGITFKPGAAAHQLELVARNKQSEDDWKSLLQYWGR
jgi:hypothetical protein